MRKIKMNLKNGRMFEQGCEDYIVDCKARNLRDGTIKHYRDAFKQIFKYLDKDMPIESILGHHSLEITQNYLNILTCDMQDDVEKFNILRTFKNESISMKKKAI